MRHDLTLASDPRRHALILRALRGVVLAATQELEPDRLLARACELLVDLGVADSCTLLDVQLDRIRVVAAAGNEAKSAPLRRMAEEGRAPPCAIAALRDRNVIALHVTPSTCTGCDVPALSPGPRSAVAVPVDYPGLVSAVLIIALPDGAGTDDTERALLGDFASDLGEVARMLDVRRGLRERSDLAESDFRTVFDQSPMGKVLAGPDGRMIRVNPAFSDMVGYPAERLEQVPFLEITHEDDRAASVALARTLLAGESDTAKIEMRYLHADGHEVWAIVSTRLLRDPTGTPRLFVTTAQDISDRKRMEQELADREARLADLLETMPIGWGEHRMIFDDTGAPTDYVFLDVNTAFERFTGLTRDAIRGRRVTEVIPGIRDAQPNLIEVYGDVVRTGRERRMEIHFAPLDRWYGLTAYKRPGDRFIVMFEDITKRKEAEREVEGANAALVRANQQLAVANKEIEAFAYSVSHDLRQPLRGIDGFSRILMDRYADFLDPTARGYLGRVRAAAQRMGSLIDDMLRLSRITRAGMTQECVDLASVAREAVDQLQAAEPERAVTWLIPPALPARGDRRLIEVMLQNLLENAWKYTGRHDRACIEVGQIPGDDGPVYFVRDDGAGFDMRYADKLFGAFQRLHGVNEFPGSGVGLATVQRIVHRHGGRIWAEAELEKGATFFFTLAQTIEGAQNREPDPVEEGKDT
jgi:PAS domain S-box-containing protein